ncbi:MAG: polysaccharide deacetylase family protein [Maioricimonas sp. JB049]
MREAMKTLVYGSLAVTGRCLPRSAPPILTYHSIDDTGAPISRTLEEFRREMTYLHDHGFRTWTLGQFVDRLGSDNWNAERRFVITFDDGFENVWSRAFPILRELDFTATIFLVTDFVDRESGWSVNEKVASYGLDRAPLLAWSHARQMQEAGFEFGSHTTNHPRLTELSVTELQDNLSRSRKTIEDNLGTACRTFCYPFGVYNPTVRDAVRQAGYEAATTLRFGRNTSIDDVYELRRIGSARFRNWQFFRACVHGGWGRTAGN